MVGLRAEPYGPARTRTGPLTARSWLIGLYVWDPVGNAHGPVRLSTSLLWSQKRRNPVSESCEQARDRDRERLGGEPLAQILAIDTTRAEQIPLRFSLRTTYRDL